MIPSVQGCPSELPGPIPARIAVKRLIDLALGSLGIVLSAPLMAAIASGVLLTIGRPVIFSQRRPGLHGRPFTLFKFRTMTNDCDEGGQLLPNERRRTTFGDFLRRTSLDELPELINVIRGDMSLVGPRPLLMEYLPYFSEEQHRRHLVRPGLTGWAQINGRNAIDWEERLRLDVWYVDNWSLGLDLRIIIRTIWLVLRRKDVAPPGQFTFVRFDIATRRKRQKPTSANKHRSP